MKNTLLIFLLVTSFSMFSQVGIGTDQPEGALDVVSSTSGLIVSRVPDVTAVVSPVNGMVVYDISTGCVRTYEDGVWTGCLTNSRVASLECGSATHIGNLKENVLASGVRSTVNYIGGNGRNYSAQTINSVGVLGLTAHLASGTLVRGDGSLEFTISGTPTSHGTAMFIISLGNELCALTIPVAIGDGLVSSLDCAGATQVGTLEAGFASSGVSSSVPYTGGNGGVYEAQSVVSTGVSGLTASLDAGILDTGIGRLDFVISGTPSGSGTASFAITLGGQSCVFTRAVTIRSGGITSLDCAGATPIGTLEEGVSASGVSSSVGYTGGNGGVYDAQTVSSTGATGLTASLASGVLNTGSGSLDFTITGTPNSSGTASFAISIGGQSCVFTREVRGAEVTVLYCSERINEGLLKMGESAVGGKTTISYDGGNGLGYDGLTINSTGVTGLTASLPSGTFATGNGDLVFTISGTPGGSGGVASFAVTIGGQSCVFKRLVAGPGEVMISPNAVWMDRNLGASQVATAKDDAASFGDLYQWGRNTDGHEKRSSGTAAGPVTAGNEGVNFITFNGDWLTLPDDTRWNSGTAMAPVKGVHDPCPSGYRVPTKEELVKDVDLAASGNTSDSYFNSALKFPAAGFRLGSSGSIIVGAGNGHYWTSSIIGSTNIEMWMYNDFGSSFQVEPRSKGASIRCVRTHID